MSVRIYGVSFEQVLIGVNRPYASGMADVTVSSFMNGRYLSQRFFKSFM